ncbi:MAG TPA: ATP-binding protein, partial [Acetobacteraceae bacterium]|nr:ATP-binding protein [Acetobacteraceae bacterium]
MIDPAEQPREQAEPTPASYLLKLASRPARLIAYPAWSKARETILARANAGPALIALLGPPGTGKTVLLRDLATTFGERGRAVCRLDFPDCAAEVGSAAIVLVDEADRLSASRLDELRNPGDVAVVVAALPESRERFECYPDATIVHL